jgi:hypothetical protein
MRAGARRRNLDWPMKQAPWTRNERIDFYNCWLMVPDGLPAHSFPRLPAKVNGGAVTPS